jgi:hypothetical protein
MSILSGAKNVSYSKIFRDQILVYGTSHVSINKEEIAVFQRDYVRMVFRCCGPNVTQDLINIFGNMESVSIMLINEFVDKVTQDELNFTNLEKPLMEE